MFYFESEKFYLDLKTFLSAEFKIIRNLYLYSYLLQDSQRRIKEELESYFCIDFINFLDHARKQYSLMKFLFVLNKLCKKLEKKYNNELFVFSNKKLDSQKKDFILLKLHYFFKGKFKVVFKVDKTIIAGLVLIYDHVMYDLSVRYVFSSVKEKVIQSIIKGVLK